MSQNMVAVSKEITLKNKYGMHARPSMQFVEVASRFNATLKVVKDGKSVDGKSIMGMMTLAAEKGTILILEADGTDANELLITLSELIENRFGEA